MTPAFALEGVSVRRGGKLVLKRASLEAAPGEVTVIIGPNGAGKTTLLQAGLGLAKLAEGRARLGGRDVAGLSEAARAALAAYMPQERRVGWNLPAWRIASLGALDLPPAQARELAFAMLARVGLRGLEGRGVLEMSGGERAKALLARLLAARAPLIVADEPVVGLDPDAQLMTLDIFAAEAARGAAVVLTLHDLTLAARTAQRLVTVHRGRVVADGTPGDVLTSGLLREVFGLDGALEATAAGRVVAVRRAVGRHPSPLAGEGGGVADG